MALSQPSSPRRSSAASPTDTGLVWIQPKRSVAQMQQLLPKNVPCSKSKRIGQEECTWVVPDKIYLDLTKKLFTERMARNWNKLSREKCSKGTRIWHQEMWFSGGFGWVNRFNELRGLFQPKLFYNSMSQPLCAVSAWVWVKQVLTVSITSIPQEPHLESRSLGAQNVLLFLDPPIACCLCAPEGCGTPWSSQRGSSCLVETAVSPLIEMLEPSKELTRAEEELSGISGSFYGPLSRSEVRI